MEHLAKPERQRAGYYSPLEVERYYQGSNISRALSEKLIPPPKHRIGARKYWTALEVLAMAEVLERHKQEDDFSALEKAREGAGV